MMSLETLLVTDAVKCFDAKQYKCFRGIHAPTGQTSETAFDLKDKENPFIVEESKGSVTYKNSFKKQIYITNYEEFVNSLPRNLQTGKKRCDFLVYQEGENSFFILNELSQSRNIEAKESDALYQLQDTLEHLCNVDSIKNKVDSCSYQLCVFSNRVKPVVAPLDMTRGFNDTFSTMKQNASPFCFEGINKFGFKYYRANLIEITEDAVLLKNCTEAC